MLAWLIPLGFGASGAHLDVVLCSLAVAFVASYMPIVRRRGGAYSAECTPGSVSIAGRTRERVRSIDIVGASLVMVDERPTELLLSLRQRRGAMRIVGRPADLEVLAKSWNLPARGLGEVDVVLAPRFLDYLAFGLRVAAALGLVALSIARPVYGSTFVGFMFGLPLAILAALVTSVIAHSTVRRTLSLSPDSLALRTPEQRRTVARASIAAARVEGAEIAITPEATPPLLIRFAHSRLLGVGLSRDVAIRIAGDLPSPARDTVSTTGLLRGGETVREWLARLDLLGDEQSDVYRGQAPTAAELWSVLESPNYEPDLRGAAARVLGKRAPDELRVRIAPVLGAIGDPEIRKRIEMVALASVDEADRDSAPELPRKNITRG